MYLFILFVLPILCFILLHPKLGLTQPVFHGNLGAVNLPFVLFLVQPEHRRFVSLRGRIQQVGDEAISLLGVVVY